MSKLTRDQISNPDTLDTHERIIRRRPPVPYSRRKPRQEYAGGPTMQVEEITLASAIRVKLEGDTRALNQRAQQCLPEVKEISWDELTSLEFEDFVRQAAPNLSYLQRQAH